MTTVEDDFTGNFDVAGHGVNWGTLDAGTGVSINANENTAANVTLNYGATGTYVYMPISESFRRINKAMNKARYNIEKFKRAIHAQKVKARRK